MKQIVVIATATPAEVVNYDLARFKDSKGEYVTNADLDTHMSPFTGKEIKASKGIPIKNTLTSIENCVGIKCPSCNSINVLPHEHASNMNKKMHCVICGSHMKYSMDLKHAVKIDNDKALAEMEYDDEDMEDNNLGGDSVGDYDPDTTPYDEDEEISKKEKKIDISKEVKNKKKQKKDVTLASLVKDEISFERIGKNRYGAFSENIMIAYMDDEEDNKQYILSSSFADGFKQTIEDNGLIEALSSAGFIPVKVKMHDVIAASVETIEKRIAHSSEELYSNNMDRLKQCMDIVASGSLVGMFKKDGMTILAEDIAKVLTDCGISNASSVLQDQLTTSLAKYNKALLTTASELQKKDDLAIAALSDQIKDMDVKPVIAEETEDEIAKRLNEPGKVVNIPLKSKNIDTARPYKGLFQVG